MYCSCHTLHASQTTTTATTTKAAVTVAAKLPNTAAVGLTSCPVKPFNTNAGGADPLLLNTSDMYSPATPYTEQP